MPQRATNRSAATICAAVAALIASAPARGAGIDRPWPRHTIDGTSRGADGVRLADVNGDGLPDIATGWEEGGRIRVYLHPGAAKCRRDWPAVTVGEVRSPEDAVFADLDGDGAVDVLSSCEGRTRTLFVHWAPPDAARYLDSRAWSTLPLPASGGQTMWMFCLPMQVDGRRGLDLVCGSKGDGARVVWWESPQNPRDLAAWTSHPIMTAGWIMSLLPDDVDGDGDLDVIVSDRKGREPGCWWLENPSHPMGPMREPWPKHPIGGQDREVMFMSHADVDGDGRKDLVAAVRQGDLLIFRRTAAATPTWQTVAVPMPPDTGGGKGVGVGDIDRDGQPDLVFSCEGAEQKHGVMWLSREPGVLLERAKWTAHPVSGTAEGVKYDLVELLDLDADGDLDVLTCEERDNLGVIWYENPR